MKPTKTAQTLQRIGHELKVNEPAIVGKTRKKYGAKRAAAQKKAILLAKARKAGARIRKRPSGSGTFSEREISTGYRCLK